jgi:hypothetical protein
VLVTFSGLDGAGKSTLIGALRQALEERRHPVVVLHMDRDVGTYAILRGARDRLTPARGRRAGPGRWRRMRDAVVWGRGLRRVLFPMDVLLFLCHRLYHERLRGRVLITDRYFYDSLVDVADGRRWAHLRWLARLAPTPSIAVFVAVGPEDSFARKGEYSVEYLRRRWVAYQRVFSWVPDAVVLANADAAASSRQLQHLVLGRMGR